jgi:parallel beta-helix repeat protein
MNAPHNFPVKSFSHRLIGAISGVIAVNLGMTSVASIAQAAPQKPTPFSAGNPQQQTILSVNPRTGDDLNGQGSELSPYRSLTRALQMATSGTIIQLAEGHYSSKTGEVFPIYLKPGVTVRGNPTTRGQGYVIRGSGPFLSRSFARQNVTILGANRSMITGVTITNPEPQGYGLWAESTSPIITDNTFTESTHDGISLVGQSRAQVRNNYFYKNGANGITIYGTSDAEVSDNIFEATGFAININQQAKPLIVGNRITQNRDGVIIQASAAPILRNNSIEGNERNGVVAIAQTQPDLGTTTEPGGNLIRNNQQLDVNITSSQVIPAFGNEIGKVAGNLDRTGQLPTIAQAPTASPVTAQPPGQKAIAPTTPKPANLRPSTPPPSPQRVDLPGASDFPVPGSGSSSPTALGADRPIQTIPVSARPPAPTVRPVQPSANLRTRPAAAPIPTPLPPAATAQPSFAPPTTAVSVPPTALALPAAQSRPTSQAISIPVPPPEVRSQPTPLNLSPQPASTAALPDLLPVPRANIPLGNIGNSPRVNVYRDQSSTPGSPPSLSSIIPLANLRYRVVVVAASEAEEAQLRELVPDAFRTVVNRRTVLQAGAFGDRAKAEELTQQLLQRGIRATVEEI